jgi:hypothetical protein
MASFNSMIDRMLKFPLNITNQREELKINNNNIARINGYDDKFVKRIYQRQKPKAELRALMPWFHQFKTNLRKELPSLSFLQGIFKRHNIDLD